MLELNEYSLNTNLAACICKTLCACDAHTTQAYSNTGLTRDLIIVSLNRYRTTAEVALKKALDFASFISD